MSTPSPNIPSISANKALALTMELPVWELWKHRLLIAGARQSIYRVAGFYWAVGTLQPSYQIGHGWEQHPSQYWAIRAGTVVWRSRDAGFQRIKKKIRKGVDGRNGPV